jgi:hypothetical protein
VSSAASREVCVLRLTGDYAIAHTRIGTLALAGWRPRELDRDGMEASLVRAEAHFAHEARVYRSIARAAFFLLAAVLAMVFIIEPMVLGPTKALVVNRLVYATVPYLLYRVAWQAVDKVPLLPFVAYMLWVVDLCRSELPDSVRGVRALHEMVASALRAGPADVQDLRDTAVAQDLPRTAALFAYNPRLRAALGQRASPRHATPEPVPDHPTGGSTRRVDHEGSDR